MRFDRLPARREDLDQLIRWQMKKAAPFPIEEALLTSTPGARGADGGAEFLVVTARRDVIAEYEAVCEEREIYAGLVDLATLSVVNLFLGASGVPDGDWLLVQVRPDYTSIAIMRGEHVIFFRNSAEGDDARSPISCTRRRCTTRTACRGRASRACCSAGAGASAGASNRRAAASRSASACPSNRSIRPASATLTDRISVTPDLMDVLAPLVGMMLRTRRRRWRLMLRTNLSTRPFYNVRAVQVVLGVLALVVLAVTLFNVVQLVRLTASQRTLSAHAVEAEREAARLRAEAAAIRGADQREGAGGRRQRAREANGIIDQRAFSWTELLRPVRADAAADVRITAVQPRREQNGSFAVDIGVQARRVEDVDAFIEALEKTGSLPQRAPPAESRPTTTA